MLDTAGPNLDCRCRRTLITGTIKIYGNSIHLARPIRVIMPMRWLLRHLIELKRARHRKLFMILTVWIFPLELIDKSRYFLIQKKERILVRRLVKRKNNKKRLNQLLSLILSLKWKIKSHNNHLQSLHHQKIQRIKLKMVSPKWRILSLWLEICLKKF